MAAISEVGICNQALYNLGIDTPIVALTDDSANARACNRVYARLRDELLRELPWNFAINRATLTALADKPGYEYINAFVLPTDPFCLRVLELREERDPALGSYPYQIESIVDSAGNSFRALVTDAATALIRYVKRVTDPTQFDTLFSQALVDLLTYRLSIPVTQSRTMAADWFSIYVDTLEKAKEINAVEGFDPLYRKMDDIGSWDSARG
jgi:hypothetical protein|tara:strand:+ start:930 stop:1559 length:630 start_codon:yes stop_codon:yes gene_type:complete